MLLLLGVLAGLINHNVLDGPRFAGEVDAIRADPAVAERLGARITDQLIAAQPDLVAIRPLIQSTASALVASPAFGPIVRSAAIRLHAAFTGQDKGAVVLRLADAGTAVIGVLRTVAPQLATRLPDRIDVTLADISSQRFAARAIHLTRVVALLSWLLPLLAAFALLGAVALARDRWRAVTRAGIAVALAGVGVGVVGVVSSIVVSRANQGTLRGAIIAAGWRMTQGTLWRAAAALALAGCVLAVAAAGMAPRLDLAALTRRGVALLTARPSGRLALVAHAAALAIVAAGILLRPELTFGLLAALVGLALATVAVAELTMAAGVARLRPPGSSGTPRRRRLGRWLAMGVLPVVAVAVIVAVVAGDAIGGGRAIAATGDGPASSVPSVSAGCEGHAQLCDRRYDQVAFAGTHNSMTAADEGWFLPEQPDGVIAQLDAGIRVFLIDSWYGQATTAPGVVATAPQNYEAALRSASAEYGADTVQAALRLRDALLPTPVGPPTPYLCHGLCELGAVEWEPLMARVGQWMTAHPREVITFIIEDQVSPADTAKVFEQAGLVKYAYQPVAGQPWPTLRQMIDSGERMVVFMERHGGGARYPWLLSGFDWIGDTPFTARSVAQLSCEPNRGAPDNPLLLLNTWVNGFHALVSNAIRVNSYDTLWPYVTKCQARRGRVANFVAVNYYDRGDLLKVVDQLNGVA